MGQYYTPYVEHNKKITVYSNEVDGEWQGLKLMEHSWWKNNLVGQVVNDLFYNKGRVCWVGDYYEEDDCFQQNCKDTELVRAIGALVNSDHVKQKKGKLANSRRLDNCLLVNHSKKIYIKCNDYKLEGTYFEKYGDEEYECCIHPLPLLTCTASHSGGSYHSQYPNHNLCGSWFYDLLEVVWDYEEEDLKEKGYKPFMTFFKERV